MEAAKRQISVTVPITNLMVLHSSHNSGITDLKSHELQAILLECVEVCSKILSISCTL